ncbi:MAG: leucine-rich repeat domain-containing protein, partial [Alistipes sp.]|nr:leucine-rich repeat domain-containing protein [Alistipes sp.]
TLNSFAPSGLTEYTIPDSVTTIGNYAFYDCDSLTSVTIPDSVTTIGYSAFADCSSLTSVTIPDSVTTIGYDAFYGCSSLTSVTIPDSVTEIGDSAFAYCDSLTSVYCKATTPPAGGSDMFYGNASGRKIYVPMDSVEAYKNAAGWKNYANDIIGYDFEQNTNESNSCTITGSHASFTMSDSGSLYSLAKKVIDNVNTTEEWGEEIWSNIISITINGMMDARDFSTLKWNFRNLEILDISNVVVTGYTGDKGTVEGYEYYYDDNTIPLGAFFYWMSHMLRPFPQELSDEGMSSLVQIKLPDGIKTIQRNAFARAYNLIDINIPDSVETIGWVSFSICTSLEHITIPENVLEIEDWAFKGCSSLNSVYCKAIYPPICGSRVFDDNASNRKIYVPMESVEAYKSAEGWSEYADDILGYDFENDCIYTPESTPATKVWLGDWSAYTEQTINIETGEINQKRTDFTFNVSVVDGYADRVYVDGLSVMGKDNRALGYCLEIEDGGYALCINNEYKMADLEDGYSATWLGYWLLEDGLLVPVYGDYPPVYFIMDANGNISSEVYVGMLVDGRNGECVAFDIISVNQNGNISYIVDENGDPNNVWKCGDIKGVTKIESPSVQSKSKSANRYKIGDVLPHSMVVASL